MSWFAITDLAKNALNEAQRKIDKALDIQGKEEIEKGDKNKNGAHINNTGKPNEIRALALYPEQQQLKKDGFNSKRNVKDVGSTVQAKTLTDTDIGEDFFSVLNIQAPDSKPRGKNPMRTSNNKKGIVRIKGSTSISDAGIRGKNSCSLEKNEVTQSAVTTYTEVPLVVSEVTQELALDEIDDTLFIERLSDTTIKDGALSLSGNSHFELEHPLANAGATNVGDRSHPNKLNNPSDLALSVAEETSIGRSGEVVVSDHESDVSSCIEGESFPAHANHIIGAPDSSTISNSYNIDVPVMAETWEENANELPSDSNEQSNQSIQAEQSHLPSNDLPASTYAQPCDEKVMELSEKTEIYEQQLLTLSERNACLNEENDNLQTEIGHMKENFQSEVKKQTEEATKSLKLQEHTNSVLIEEKKNLLKQLAVLKSQLASRMTNEQVQSAIAEKEESIKGLMEEGEGLAKKLLQQNNLIKKLKSHLQEKETELKSFREKSSKYEEVNSRLKEELKLVKGQGQEERETSLRISDAYEQRERETQILQEKLVLSEEKQRTLQVNLDAAYKEIGDLHKQIAEQESKTLAEWNEKESVAIRDSDLEKKKIISEQEHQKQLLMLQIMELNNSVCRAEASASRKDDDHRREIKELRERLQESEGRNQDLSNNVSSATRPLLRQIENLQATHSSQQRSWNALEKTLNSRLGEAHAELLAARESERIAQSMSIEARSKASAFEKHIENDKVLISQYENKIEVMRREIAAYKSQLKSTTEELEEMKAVHKEMVHKSRKERLFLENQLQMEKVRSEADHKKYAAQQEALQREKEKIMWGRSEIASVSSNQITETESVGSSNDAFHQTDGLEKHLSSSSLPGLASQLSFEGGRGMSVSNVLENLQTQLKLKDGEIAQLRGEINMLEKTRSSMAEEIVRLTNINEDLDGVSGQLQDMKGKLAEVENRYTAILTMYGEKEEENEELKMDLVDVKAMYRQQISDLLKGEQVS